MGLPLPIYVAAGTASAGTTSVAPAIPAGLVAGTDRMLMFITNKYPNNTPLTPAGWTLVGQVSGGKGSAGVDSGNVYVTAFWRDYDGTEGASVTVTITSGNSAVGRIFGFRRDESAYWAAPAMVSNSQGSASTSWTVQSSANADVRFGDMLVVASGQNTDSWTNSAQTVTLAGCTFTNETERMDQATANGDDVRQIVSTHECATGRNMAGKPSYSMTASGSDANSPAGATMFVVMRMLGPPAVHMPTKGRRSMTVLNRVTRAASSGRNKANELEEQMSRRFNR